jgi:phosphopantetheinyl transferase (holo-ACP synthase)
MKNNFNSIGIDIFDNSDYKRFKKTLLYALTDLEKKYFDKIENKKNVQNYLISRWVAKEAIVKILDAKVNIRSLSILNHESGKPYCFEYPDIEISISHSKKSTICVAIWKN